jgi:hypothetical protein
MGAAHLTGTPIDDPNEKYYTNDTKYVKLIYEASVLEHGVPHIEGQNPPVADADKLYYFTTINRIGACLKDDYYITDVTVPEGVAINIKMHEKSDRIYSASQITLSNVRTIGEMKQWKSPSFCLDMVKQHGNALRYVPPYNRTDIICSEAIGNYPFAIKYIPTHKQTEQLCQYAIERDYRTAEYVRLTDESFWMSIVEKNVHIFRYVPGERKTHNLCVSVVKRYGSALRFVPVEIKTDDVCLLAVKQYGCALDFVHNNDKTEEMCVIAVTQDARSVRYVPEKFINEKIQKILREHAEKERVMEQARQKRDRQARDEREDSFPLAFADLVLDIVNGAARRRR